MPSQRHHEPGDLYVKFTVTFPESLDPAVIPHLEAALPPRAVLPPPPKGFVVDEVDLEARGFWMTPPPNSDEPGGPFTTSSAIRTRAKLSNRNPSARAALSNSTKSHDEGLNSRVKVLR